MRTSNFPGLLTWMVVLWATVFVLAPEKPAHAIPPYWRLYYAYNTTGNLSFSPADPSRAFSGTPITCANKSELEVLLWGHLGLGIARQPWERQFLNGANVVDEQAEEWSSHATLYLRAASHNRFNAFLGAGQGHVERYQQRINGLVQTNPANFSQMPINRTFFGIEYTWERIGMRLEWSAVKAIPAGVAPAYEYHMQQLVLFIPLN